MAKLTQTQLATRWQISPRTLEQWRWLGKGPKFLKIGARLLYDEADIEAFEGEPGIEALAVTILSG